MVVGNSKLSLMRGTAILRRIKYKVTPLDATPATTRSCPEKDRQSRKVAKSTNAVRANGVKHT
jgi:hypothetical protein